MHFTTEITAIPEDQSEGKWDWDVVVDLRDRDGLSIRRATTRVSGGMVVVDHAVEKMKVMILEEELRPHGVQVLRRQGSTPEGDQT